MKQVCFGYSMYEVDGVVFIDRSEAKKRIGEGNIKYKDLIGEDKVQIIRFHI